MAICHAEGKLMIPYSGTKLMYKTVRAELFYSAQERIKWNQIMKEAIYPITVTAKCKYYNTYQCKVECT